MRIIKRKVRRGELDTAAAGASADRAFTATSPLLLSGKALPTAALASSDEDPLADLSLARSTAGVKTELMLAEEDDRKLQQLATYLDNAKKTSMSIVEVLEGVEERITQVGRKGASRLFCFSLLTRVGAD